MFPKNFIWGTASSAYQIEGACDIDKIPSIWDTFSNTEGNVFNNENGNIACDSYHLYKEDIALMKEFNIKAYRFSISWCRIFEEDMKTINPQGLAYYIDLVDTLIANDIKPLITLFHWDLPQVLEDKGGWLNEETVRDFEFYAGVIARTFNKKVYDYITINEPQIIVGHGYAAGIHAPGKKLEDTELIRIIHNILRAHGLAVNAIRKNSEQKVNVSIASTGKLTYPKNNSVENIEAAYHASFILDQSNPLFSHSLFLDPVFLKRYPDGLSSEVNEIIKGFPKEDFDLISTPLDYLCINIYNGQMVDNNGNYIDRYPGFPQTAIRWPVSPEVMSYGLKFIYRRYKHQIVISENGQSANDRIHADGYVHDINRIDFMYKYLHEVEKIINEVPVIGYLHWSFTDNFEWHNGYNERFGLIYIDYRNKRRIPKDSVYYYSKIINENKLIELKDFITVKYNN